MPEPTETAAGPSKSERRVHARVPVQGEARYRLMRGGQSTRKPGGAKLQNLSAGGVCVEASDDVRPGDIIKIDFGLPGTAATVTALVEVIWTEYTGKTNRVGGRYVAIRPEEVEQVATYVADKLKSA